MIETIPSVPPEGSGSACPAILPTSSVGYSWQYVVIIGIVVADRLIGQYIHSRSK